MLTLYSGSGAGGFSLLDRVLDDAEWDSIREAAVELLVARNMREAADLLTSIPFEVFEGTNSFGDDFCVLHAAAPHADYVKLSSLKGKTAAFGVLAMVLAEAGTPYIRFVSTELQRREKPALVATPEPRLTADAVERALRDAQRLLLSSGAVSAVDRAHTALHGYMKLLCAEADLPHTADAGVTELLKVLRQSHPGFSVDVHDSEVGRVLKGLSTVLDSINTLRNRGTVAHPNVALLSEPEAVLALNSIRTLLHYMDAKTRA